MKEEVLVYLLRARGEGGRAMQNSFLTDSLSQQLKDGKLYGRILKTLGQTLDSSFSRFTFTLSYVPV